MEWAQDNKEENAVKWLVLDFGEYFLKWTLDITPSQHKALSETRCWRGENEKKVASNKEKLTITHEIYVYQDQRGNQICEKLQREITRDMNVSS